MIGTGLCLLLQGAFAGTIVDASGKSVTADRTTKLLTLGGGVTESVYAIGAGSQVVGVDRTSLYPPEVESLPKVSYFRQLTAEGLIALGPDLIVATEAAGPDSALAQVEGAGIRVVRLTDEASVDGAKTRLRQLGTLLDRKKEAKRSITSLDSALAKVEGPPEAPRVLFVYARGAGSLQVSGRDTTAAEMIRLAGGTNAVSSWLGYKPLTAEGIIAAQPDVVLLTSRGLESIGGAKGLWSQPGMAVTPAGKAGRVVTLDDLLLLGFGPRTGQAVQELAQKLAGTK